MEQYIKKFAVVSEIERWVNGWTERLNTKPSNPSFFEGGVEMGKSILHFLDTLEAAKPTVDNNKTMLNACINTLRNVGHSHLAAWLEKQGEQKENATRNKIAEYLKKLILDQSQRGAHMLDYEGRIEEEVDFIINIAKKELEQGEHKSAVKVESKFEVGKWIVSNNKKDIFLINSANNGYYTLEDTKGNIYTPCVPPVEDDYHLWTIQDAKPGDVLAEDSCMFIIKKLNNDNSAEIYCCLHDDGVFDVALGLVFDETSTHPVTKEQRDLLFQNMKEAGYEWDAEKKELKKN